MKDTIKYSIIALVGIAILTVGLSFIGVLNFKIFGTAYENTRREVFKESQAYNEGMAQDISNIQQQYLTATPSQKDALAALILQRTSGYEINNLPSSQKAFIEKLRRGER